MRAAAPGAGAKRRAAAAAVLVLCALAPGPAFADDWDDLPMPAAGPASAPSGADACAGGEDSLLAGRVLDARTRAPIEGALVEVKGDRAATSGTGGCFVVPGGKSYAALEVRVSAPGYRARRLREPVARVRERGAVVYLLRRPFRLPKLPPVRLAPAPTLAPPPLAAGAAVRTLDRDDVDGLAGTFGDPLRALSILPGVGRMPYGTPFPLVRGSLVGEAATRLEGHPFPVRFHFGALHAALPPGLLGSVELHPDGSAPLHGRVLGAVIELRLREDLPPRPVLGLAVDPIVATLHAELPLGRDAALYVVSRRTWLDLAISAGGGPGAAGALPVFPRFSDAAVLLLARPRPGHLARLLWLVTEDRAAYASTPVLSSGMALLQHRALATWRAPLPRGGSAGASLSAGATRFRANLAGDLHLSLSVTDVSFRQDVLAPVARALSVAVGLELTAARADWRSVLDVGLVVPQGRGVELRLRARETLRAAGAWTELHFAPIDGLLVVPGVRLDWTDTAGDAWLDPRLRARWRAHSIGTLHASVARASAPADAWDTGLGLEPTAVAGPAGQSIPFDPGLLGLSPFRAVTAPARALEASAGVELRPIPVVTLEAVAFHRELHRLGPPNAFERALLDGWIPTLTPRDLAHLAGAGDVFDASPRTGRGRATGLELSARFHPARPLRLSLAYTLSRSVRWDGADPASPRLPAPFHRPHVLAAAAAWESPWGLRVAVRWRLTAGGRLLARGPWDADADLWRPSVAPERAPPFHSLDVRVDWRVVTPVGPVTFWLELLDAYARRNPEETLHSADHRMHASPTGWPLMPFGGLRADFQ